MLFHSTPKKMAQRIKFKLNGNSVGVEIKEDEPLLDVLRSSLNKTGTKFGCGLGYCGSCTVLINGKAARSCMTTADFVEGKEVVTIEGLASENDLHPIQQAFIDNDAFQCGFCTPGMIMTAAGFLNENPAPSRQEIIDGMEENLCRCGTHGRIIKSIQEASEVMKQDVKL